MTAPYATYSLSSLRDEGFDAAPARDGASALRLAVQGFDAVALDVGMPESDGRDVCHALRVNGYLAPSCSSRHTTRSPTGSPGCRPAVTTT